MAREKARGSLAARQFVLRARRVCLSIAAAALRKPLTSDLETMPATPSEKRKMSMPEKALRVALGELVSGVVLASAKSWVTTSHLKLRWPLELQSASSPIQEILPIEPA